MRVEYSEFYSATQKFASFLLLVEVPQFIIDLKKNGRHLPSAAFELFGGLNSLAEDVLGRLSMSAFLSSHPTAKRDLLVREDRVSPGKTYAPRVKKPVTARAVKKL